MDESGVNVQVLSLTTPALQGLDPELAVELAQQANDLIGETIRQYPDRFEGFATLPTPNPDEAARELERAVTTLGCKGAMLFGRTRDRNLDHPDFLPIFEMAANLQAPIYLHPQIPAPAVREAYYSGFGEQMDGLFATAGWGWHIETGIQAVRLILSGIFDRFPDLQIILGHWGESMLFYLERINVMSESAEHLQRPIASYVRENFYVTPSGMFSSKYLNWSLDEIGAERIMFSTDYPYLLAPRHGARDFIEKSAIPDATKQLIANGNWQRLSKQVRYEGTIIPYHPPMPSR
ncbi:MAG: amidohydrolase [Chroococcidiopsidaceae cyanobacterium CP_BM_RX_35]|nr:amidohydrolase [Chroococcidiopsidaceae cyanobacterium CP_BM_RX_35]